MLYNCLVYVSFSFQISRAEDHAPLLMCVACLVSGHGFVMPAMTSASRRRPVASVWCFRLERRHWPHQRIKYDRRRSRRRRRQLSWSR